MKLFFFLLFFFSFLFSESKVENPVYTVTIYKPERKVYENVTELDWESGLPGREFKSSKKIRLTNNGKDIIVGEDWIAEEK